MSTKYEFLQHFPHFTWDFTPEFLEKRSMDLLANINKRIDKLNSLSEDNINFQSVCESLADIEAEIYREKNIVEFYFNASTEGNVQDKCWEISKTWSDFFAEHVMRRDVYDLLTKVQSIEKSLPYESARYLEKSLLYKRRDGLHLEADDREKLTSLLKQISNRCIDFNKNISDEDAKIEFEKSDLLGMSEYFINGLAEKDGKYTVSLSYPLVFTILKQCKIIKTRQIIEKAYHSRFIDKNVKILEEVLELRHERVKILGYKTHVDFVTEILMSKSADLVHAFLTHLFEKLQNSLKKEMDRLLELKKNDCEEMGVPFDGKINVYDSSYYQNMVEEKDYKINKNLVKEYFPCEHVTVKLLDIYQTLLGLRFEQVFNPPAIHSEVVLYAVYDKATYTLMGYFYIDIFHRPFKYSQTTCFCMQSASYHEKKPQLGCASLLANFNRSLPNSPSLLTHEEVIKYFHELGHVMHQICSKTKYSIFHWTSVERDFVEAPSQMLENFCWEKESLKKISSHYKTRQPLPDELIEKIINSRRANISIYYARQICLSMFDLIIHTTPKDCMIKYTGIEPTPGTNFAASFIHMCSGYDAQYYGYVWSQVYSYDMFSKFKTEGILSYDPGLSFRNQILVPGATKDGSEMFREFLGREPMINPFLEILGIKLT